MNMFLGNRARGAFTNQPAASGGGSSSGGNITIHNYGDGHPTIPFSVGDLDIEGTTTAVLAEKDTWIPNVALCPDDANKDGTDLEITGVAAVRQDVYLGWGLSNYLAGTTVTAASLTVNVATAAVSGDVLSLNHLANADEGWAEGSLTCSGALGLTAFQTDATGFVATGDRTFTLNATARSRIASRMGAGNYSVVFTADTAHTNAILESADEGTNDSQGPRLTFSWNKQLA